MKAHGQILDFVNDQTLQALRKLFYRQDDVKTSKSVLQSIPKEHMNMSILEKFILSNLKDSFGDDIKIGVCNYTCAYNHYGIHFDDYQVLKYGQPYVSVLIPVTGIEDFSTFVFDLESEKNDPREFKSLIKKLPVKHHEFDPDLEHVDTDLLSRLDILGKYSWKKNSAIYWQTNLLHCSSKHPKTIAEKEFIIIHTYL